MTPSLKAAELMILGTAAHGYLHCASDECHTCPASWCLSDERLQHKNALRNTIPLPSGDQEDAVEWMDLANAKISRRPFRVKVSRVCLLPDQLTRHGITKKLRWNHMSPCAGVVFIVCRTKSRTRGRGSWVTRQWTSLSEWPRSTRCSAGR